MFWSIAVIHLFVDQIFFCYQKLTKQAFFFGNIGMHMTEQNQRHWAL